ncbi:MAG: hypothetical protein NUV69_04505 [Candidatus Curtissbacteria bacterium]|nr:hypothetical protein [Candidatus Curtissbacteria bacterium]
MKCQKLLGDNRKCRAFAQKGKDYCFRHDPDQADNALFASQKGGENRSLRGIYGKNVKIESPEDVKVFLGKVINGVWAGGVPVQVGSSMGFLSRCWLDAYDASDVTKRIDGIEEKISKFNSSRQ